MPIHKCLFDAFYQSECIIYDGNLMKQMREVDLFQLDIWLLILRKFRIQLNPYHFNIP